MLVPCALSRRWEGGHAFLGDAVCTGEATGPGAAPWRSFPEGVTGLARGEDRVTLQTRVSSSALMHCQVDWEVARDPDFAFPVAGGRVRTAAHRGYAVEVAVAGLAAGQVYYFRFRYLEQVSPVGRVQTLPVALAKAL